MSTRKYVRRTTAPTVEGIEYTGNNLQEIREWTTTPGRDAVFRAAGKGEYPDPNITAAIYDYLHSTWIGVRPGDTILRGGMGEHYPIAPGPLAATYTLADEGRTGGSQLGIRKEQPGG